jgi:ParB family chromosome partitioning protein
LNAIKPASTGRPEPSPITDRSGTKLGALLMSPKEVRISAEGTLGIEFLKFVEAELPALTERFARQRENEKP